MLPLTCTGHYAQVTDMICKLSKKGTTPSQIGVILRDHHGVGRVTTVTGTKILRILRKLGLAPEIPEDLYFLIKKAVSMRKHLDVFRKDRDAKFRLILVESRIHRLARYYKVPPRPLTECILLLTCAGSWRGQICSSMRSAVVTMKRVCSKPRSCHPTGSTSQPPRPPLCHKEQAQQGGHGDAYGCTAGCGGGLAADNDYVASGSG